MVASWQISNVPGPKLGKMVTSEVAAKIIKKAERPLIVVGAEITNLDVTKLPAGIPIVATAHSAKYFLEKNIKVSQMGILDLINLLRDNEWKGLDGDGNYDLVIFLGIEYWLLSQMANTLKNFTEIETLNLSRYYQPNATFSLPNLTEEIWLKYLDKLCKQLKE